MHIKEQIWFIESNVAQCDEGCMCCVAWGSLHYNQKQTRPWPTWIYSILFIEHWHVFFPSFQALVKKAVCVLCTRRDLSIYSVITATWICPCIDLSVVFKHFLSAHSQFKFKTRQVCVSWKSILGHWYSLTSSLVPLWFQRLWLQAEASFL